MVEPSKTPKAVNPIWKCRVVNCDYTAPPTLKGYEKLRGHQLYHATRGMLKEERGFHLIDESTGEILAQTLKEAREKLLLMPETGKLPEKIQPTPPVSPPTVSTTVEEAKPPEVEIEIGEPPEAKPEAKGEKEEEKEKEITTPQASSEGIFRYTITLPADAFTLFNLAKACGLEKDGRKLFDEWVWDCIRKRYESDYKMQLVLAPVEEKHA